MEFASEAARQLYLLRKRSGLSRAAIGKLIGMPATTFATYDTKVYKQNFLPMEVVHAVLPHLTGRGVPPITADEVVALAGVTFARDGQAILPQQIAPTVEPGITVRERVPKIGDTLDDEDELALLKFFRPLSITKRAAVWVKLEIEDELPSLRDHPLNRKSA